MNAAPATRSGCSAARMQPALPAHREPDDDSLLRRGSVHDGDGVGRVLALVVCLGLCGTIRLAVAAPVEGDHATMPGQVRDLHLPVAGMDNRPGGEEEHRGLALAVDLVEDPHAVALDEALLVRIAGPRLLARLCGYLFRCRHDLSFASIHPSIHSRRAAWPVSMPESLSSMTPSLKVITSETSASRGISIP